MAEAKRILVVDDQRPVAEMLLAVLKEEGFDVRVCVDSGRAVARASSFQPHLVILDLVMPGLSGRDVLKDLRSTVENAHTPVLLVTAYPSAAALFQANHVEGVEFLSKPFDVDELVDKIRGMLNTH